MMMTYEQLNKKYHIKMSRCSTYKCQLKRTNAKLDILIAENKKLNQLIKQLTQKLIDAGVD